MKLQDLAPFEHELIERLAAQQWAGWTQWMLEKWNDTHQPDGEPFKDRWARQCQTAYTDLSEEEKASAREEALRMYEIFDAWVDDDPALTPEQEAELEKADTHWKPFSATTLEDALQRGIVWAEENRKELRTVRSTTMPRQAGALYCLLLGYRDRAEV